MYLLRLMLVGVWLGLLWVLFYFFDNYIQSSVQFSSVWFSGSIYAFWFDIAVVATYDAHGCLVSTLLGILFSFFDHYVQSSVWFSLVQFLLWYGMVKVRHSCYGMVW